MRALAGERFTCLGPAGGGYGDPLERPPERVLDDVRDGLISVASARRDYGVVIGSDMIIDTSATKDERRAMRESAPERNG